jgi:hypothetical protein
MKKKIFLSYALPDKEKIPSIVERLRQHEKEGGQEVTIEDPAEKLSEGEDLRIHIKEQIKASDEVVIVWTETSAASGSVNYEAGMADALGKSIVFVVSGEGGPELPKNIQPVGVVKFDEET